MRLATADERLAVGLEECLRALGILPTLDQGEVELLPVSHTLRGPAGTQRLTPTELHLLACLLRHRGTVLDRCQLAELAWNRAASGFARETEVYVSRVRRKLANVGAAGRIETVRGRGYRVS